MNFLIDLKTLILTFRIWRRPGQRLCKEVRRPLDKLCLLLFTTSLQQSRLEIKDISLSLCLCKLHMGIILSFWYISPFDLLLFLFCSLTAVSLLQILFLNNWISSKTFLNFIQSLQRTFRGLKQQQVNQNGNNHSTSGFRFDNNHNNVNTFNNHNNINNFNLNQVQYSLKRKSTSPNRYHHYQTEEMCEFQVKKRVPISLEFCLLKWIFVLQF